MACYYSAHACVGHKANRTSSTTKYIKGRRTNADIPACRRQKSHRMSLFQRSNHARHDFVCCLSTRAQVLEYVGLK